MRAVLIEGLGPTLFNRGCSLGLGPSLMDVGNQQLFWCLKLKEHQGHIQACMWVWAPE